MTKYESITSKHNPKVERWKKLSSSKEFRHEEKSVLIEGKNLVLDLIASDKRTSIVSIILSESAVKNAPQIALQCQRYVLPDSLFRVISSVETPEGYIVECKFSTLGQSLETYLQSAIIDIRTPILILDTLQDPGNIGTLLRSAALFSVKTIILIEPSCDVWNPKALRAAKGAHFHMNIISSSWDEIKKLHKSLPPLFVTYPPGENVISIRELSLSSKWVSTLQSKDWALVLGNEGRGVTIPSTIEHTRITIPTNTVIESLNVAQAGAICLYAFSCS